MRKLATIRKIDALTPIEGADKIELATVGGWKVVCQKGLYNEGDLAVYFEIDSWIPHTLAPFLSKGQFPRVFEGVEGERLKTIKLRGQLSQGLLLPLFYSHSEGSWCFHPSMHYLPERVTEGQDVTERLGIQKWEPVIPAQLAGEVRGLFPSVIPKTDQERVQNLKKEVTSAIEDGTRFEITEKLEGSSMTVYRIQGEFGVCSRNMNLKEVKGNAFWDTAIAEDINAKMQKIDPFWDFAIQGELVGPGIQGNIYGLSELNFYVFDVYDIQTGAYMKPGARRGLIDVMGLKHVPVLAAAAALKDSMGITNVDGLLRYAEGQSILTSIDVEREGVVFKEAEGGFTFKAISNKYLMGEK